MADPAPRTGNEIAVHVITGFLGSGKTTLLQQLLDSPELGDTAVLINEFGEVGLDHLLLEQVDEDIVMLESGCVCCTIRGDLGVAIRDLLARRDSGVIPPFRRLVIETTGLADPVPILYTLMTEPGVNDRCVLGSVITTVDAVNGTLHLARQPESTKQAAVADRLVITKTDIADPVETAALEARLARLNPSARILHAPFSEFDADALLAGSAYDPQAKGADVRHWLDEEAYRDAGDHDHHHAPDVNRHDEHIGAFCLTFDKPIDWTAFGVWLTMLLHRRGEDVLRVKGLLNVDDALAGPVVVHGVQHVIHPPAHLDAWPDDDRRSRLVFITRDIGRDEIEASLSTFNALADPGTGTDLPEAPWQRPHTSSAGRSIGGRPVRRPGAPAWMK